MRFMTTLFRASVALLATVLALPTLPVSAASHRQAPIVSLDHDVCTLDTHARALASYGDYEHAETQRQKTLAVGFKDPKLLLHAGAVELRLGHNDKAELYLRNGASLHSREALRLLRDMQGKPGAESE